MNHFTKQTQICARPVIVARSGQILQASGTGRVLGVVEQDGVKVDVEFVLIDHVEEEEIEEKEHDNEARIEQKYEFNRSDQIGECQQNYGRQREHDVEELIEELIVVGWVRLDVVHFLRLFDNLNL